jgi:hypothetical protein
MSLATLDHALCSLPVQDDEQPWPAEAREMMSRLSDCFPPLMERRKMPRWRYRVEAHLIHAAHAADPLACPLYTRDVNAWSVGFITSRQLTPFDHAVVRLPAPSGLVLHIPCLIRRCRLFAPGWYHGVLDFDREHGEFATG